MMRLDELIGIECGLDRLSNVLRQFAFELGAPVVGACHVTCSDEAEHECVEAFQRWFARELLPELKPDRRWPFCSRNVGARYEWGAIRAAEEHFAAPASRDRAKLMVVKINAHTAARPAGEGVEYGYLDRYGHTTTCCGALAGVFTGSLLPVTEQLRELFRYGGVDRLALLSDQSVVAPQHRALLAAVTSARLQAQRAVLDIEAYRPVTPTVFLVLPCVTINRPGQDTELLVGQYGIDRTGRRPLVKYDGLGDDPAAYRIRYEQGLLALEDADWPAAPER